MPEVKKMMNQWIDAEGNKLYLSGEMVIAKGTGEDFGVHAADTARHMTTQQVNTVVETAITALKNGDIKTLSDALVQLKGSVDAFLTGEPDAGTMDRLSELVAAINANKDSIDALVTDHLTQDSIADNLTTDDATKVLSAKQGKVLKDLISTSGHTHANADVLNKLSLSQEGGLLVDGEAVGGGGIAFMASADATPVFNGKLKIVVSDYTPPTA